MQKVMACRSGQIGWWHGRYGIVQTATSTGGVKNLLVMSGRILPPQEVKSVHDCTLRPPHRHQSDRCVVWSCLWIHCLAHD